MKGKLVDYTEIIRKIPKRLNLKDLWNVLKTQKGLLKYCIQYKAHWLGDDGQRKQKRKRKKKKEREEEKNCLSFLYLFFE